MVVILGEHNTEQEELFLKYASEGEFGLLKGVVEQGVKNIDVRNSIKQTALHLMVQAGADEESIRYLVEAGAEVDARDYTGMTPLMVAFSNNNLEAARYLIERAGADPKAKDNYDKGIASHMFRLGQSGRDEKGDALFWLAVKHLDTLQGATDPKAFTNNLHKVVLSGDLNSVEKLLLSGVDPNQGHKQRILLPKEIPTPAEKESRRVFSELGGAMMRSSRSDIVREIFKAFRSLPAVPDDLSSLTTEALLASNEKGHRLLDNPMLWRRMPEVIATLEAKGEPLPNHEQLSSGGVMGNSPLSIALHTRAFDAVEQCLAVHGERISAADFGAKQVSKFGEAALETNLLNEKIMLPERWIGKLPELRRFYQELPDKARDSVENYQQLQQQVRATMPQIKGLGR